MEPGVIIGSGLAILGSKDLLSKLLGPSADYVGGEIKGLVQKCNVNLDNIFQKAARKAGDRIEDGSTVNPRVLKHIVDEGRFCEDDLTAEYYGGILASSRSRTSRDDRGVTLLTLVKAMSVYQLRFHFVAYSLFCQLFHGQKLNMGDGNDCVKMTVFIPMEVFESAMAFTTGENPDAILAHCLFGLNKHNLIANNFCSGPAEFLQKQKHQSIPCNGIVLAPTLPGAELFIWALGMPGASGREIVDVVLGKPPINIPTGALSLPAMIEKSNEQQSKKSLDELAASLKRAQNIST